MPLPLKSKRPKDLAEDRRRLIKQRGRGQWLSFGLTGAIVAAASVFFAVGDKTAGIAFLGSDVILVSIALAGGVVDLPKRRHDDSDDNRSSDED